MTYLSFQATGKTPRLRNPALQGDGEAWKAASTGSSISISRHAPNVRCMERRQIPFMAHGRARGHNLPDITGQDRYRTQACCLIVRAISAGVR